jgi:hypothetical protein
MNRNTKPSSKEKVFCVINPLNAELNPICHLLALLGAHHILHISRIRVNAWVFRKFLPKVWVIKLVEPATAAVMHNNSPVRIG